MLQWSFKGAARQSGCLVNSISCVMVPLGHESSVAIFHLSRLTV